MLKISAPIVLLALLFWAGCNNKKNHTSVQSPSAFTVKGSDTEFELVKKLFTLFNESDSLPFVISGGGTELGIKALINGEVDMATASREVDEKEQRLLDKQNISALPIMFATDAVAIITHSRLGVDSLSLDQLSEIFKGNIVNWKELGGPDRKITLYIRNFHSGTAAYFKNKVTHGEVFSGAVVCEDTKSIVDKVIMDSTGIGYVGAGFLMNEDGKPSGKVWAMPLSIDSKHPAYSPYQTQEVKAGNYPLTRPLYQYYKLPLTQKVKDFILHELSLNGQTIIRRFGYFPINDYQKEINKMNGLQM